MNEDQKVEAVVKALDDSCPECNPIVKRHSFTDLCSGHLQVEIDEVFMQLLNCNHQQKPIFVNRLNILKKELERRGYDR